MSQFNICACCILFQFYYLLSTIYVVRITIPVDSTGLDKEKMLKTGVKAVSFVVPGRMQTVQSGTPMQCVAMDILGPLSVTTRGNRYILVIADYFTKWVEAFPMPNMEATTVAQLFVSQFICRFGTLEFLHTDQGRNFESAIIKESCKLLGITKTRTSPYHPQSDGLVERFNRVVYQPIEIDETACTCTLSRINVQYDNEV